MASYTPIPGISPTAPISQQMEQIDQQIVALLQDIDESFSNLHQTVATRLIPSVKRFNQGCEPGREFAKVRFFPSSFHWFLQGQEMGFRGGVDGNGREDGGSPSRAPFPLDSSVPDIHPPPTTISL